MAEGMGGKVGKVLKIEENIDSGSPVYTLDKYYDVGVGGTPIEPGSTTVSKSVIVTFELK